MTYLLLIIIVSGFSSFAICLADKWGFVEWVQINGNDFFSKMFSCHFCLSWWTNVIACILIAIFMRDWAVLFLPFITTNITKKLL